VADPAHVAGRQAGTADERRYRGGDYRGDRGGDLGGGVLEAADRAGENPTFKTLTSFSQFFKVPFGFFGDDPGEAEGIGDQLALLVLLREKGVSRLRLRSFAGLSSNSRRMILDMIDSAVRIEEQSGE
jgi:hypothetical protein